MNFSGMKIFLVLLLLLTSVSCAFAEEKPLREMASDVPCTCVFDENRSWNPKTITYNGYVWDCEHYNGDGTCARVRNLGNAPQKQDGQDKAQDDTGM